MLLSRGVAIFVLVIIEIIVLIAQIITAHYLHSLSQAQISMIGAAFFIVEVGGILFIILLSAFILGVTWLEYVTYSFCISEESFKVKHGILSTEETSLLYRQIQNVDVERPLIYRLFGLSRLVILTAGNEDPNAPEKSETEGILPALDSVEAKQIQDELLRRSNIQEVVAVPREERDATTI